MHADVAAVDAGAGVTTAPLASANEPAAPAPAIVWRDDEREADLEAKMRRWPMLVHFYASWCSACVELERVTFASAEVRAALARVVPVRVDATDDQDPVASKRRAEYRVVGLPTVVLVDWDGRELARFVEFVPPEKMAATRHLVGRHREEVLSDRVARNLGGEPCEARSFSSRS
jgi:thiol:disulfide interchange protein DsbD